MQERMCIGISENRTTIQVGQDGSCDNSHCESLGVSYENVTLDN